MGKKENGWSDLVLQERTQQYSRAGICSVLLLLSSYYCQ